jgi:divalent metal cation (Fe/Co/Zn/Cd) transporter
LIAIIAGLLAGSIALVGFGFDSVIEVSSGIALLWRLHVDKDVHRRERAEQISLRIVGWAFLALAAYVAYDSITLLIYREQPVESLPGIILAIASLIIMPLLASAKRKVARRIGSNAMIADAKQTELCTYLSAILSGGLLLNALWGDGGLTRLLPS